MEATGLHDFRATAPDELSFSKGQKLKIVSMKGEADWFTAETMEGRFMVPSNYIKMEESSWYHGEVSRVQTKDLLQNKHLGAFLIRDSESGVVDDKPKSFSLSVKTNKGVEHFRIMSDEQGKYFLWTTKFDFLNELVHYHQSNSVSRTDDVKLKYVNETPNPSRSMVPPTRRVVPPPGRIVVEPPKPRVQAIYDFIDQEQDGDTLMFRVGDIITVLEETDENWWRGQLNDKIGFFPVVYVKKYQP